MPRSSSSANSPNGSSSKKIPAAASKKTKPSSSSAASTAAAAKNKKKQPAKKKPPTSTKPAPKSRVVSHTDDGTPIVNATLSQIRRGLAEKASNRLVRIPQNAERSKFYVEAARAIGERESLALPYHGGRMWRCVVRVYDENGASGDNREGASGGGGGKDANVDFADCDDDDNDGEARKKKRIKTNYHSHTPLFRWYRGGLVLATLPYILDDIVEVRNRQTGKKRWANGLSDDELDSSDEEWDDGRYVVEPATRVTMEASALTTSAYEDTCHPMPKVSRVWISPDLRRFASRRSAMAHAEDLVGRDLLVDRVMYGYGRHGARLRPVKPTRKVALEAGMVRFLRDGLWVVGQEEMWIERRRDILVRKQQRRLLRSLREEGEEGDGGNASTSAAEEGEGGEDSKGEVVSKGDLVCEDEHDAKIPSSAIATSGVVEISDAAISPTPVLDAAPSPADAMSRIDVSIAAQPAIAAATQASAILDEWASQKVEAIYAFALTAAADYAVRATEIAQSESNVDSMPVAVICSADASCGITEDATANQSSIDLTAAVDPAFLATEILQTDSTVDSMQEAKIASPDACCGIFEDATDIQSSSNLSAAVDSAVCLTEILQSDSTVDSMPEAMASCGVSVDATGNQSSIDETNPDWHANTKIVSPEESDASTDGASKGGDIVHQNDAKRAVGTRPPPEFVPSIHYRLNKDQIARCFAACVDHYENVMHTVKARSLYHELADGFDVFRERGRGRYDMELALFDTEDFSFLTDRRRAAWMPIVHKILGDDALLVHKGCFISLPGAESQVYHQDGVHLNQKTHKPCYAINVFIPLVDYNNLNGPTEFCLGSHYLGHENFVKENAYVPCVKAGTPVIFDYRLG
jgi:hypothetical protein